MNNHTITPINYSLDEENSNIENPQSINSQDERFNTLQTKRNTISNIANFPKVSVNTNSNSQIQGKISFKKVAIEWFKYKYTFTEASKDNPNPLSRKTLQGYNNTLNLDVIPFFNDNTDITLLTNEDFKSCIDKTNGSRNKEDVYVVLSMIANYAKEKNYIEKTISLSKPKRAQSDSKIRIEGHDFIYIESNRQNYWMDCFEKEGTDIAYLFEGMLLEGFRPEEACGLDWTCFVEDFNFVIVKQAFKDFPVYNEYAEVIGHIREYDTLKTKDSYRKLPVHPRYRNILIKHKKNQKLLFKRLGLKWTENTPVFLNKYHQTYVPENLSKAMNSFRKKYNLEYLTPYGLRHSFATFLSEHGVKDIVLMKLMGHSEFATTQKYYIFVSDERKRAEYEQAWGISTIEKEENTVQNDIADDLLKQQLENLQKLWMKTLIESTLVVQKNNAI